MTRKWHQLHPATVIVLVLLAIAFLAANVIERTWVKPWQPGVIWTGRGWPDAFTRSYRFENPDEWYEIREEYSKTSGEHHFKSNHTDALVIILRGADEGQYNAVFMLINLLIGGLVMAIAAVLIEIFTRQREERKA